MENSGNLEGPGNNLKILFHRYIFHAIIQGTNLILPLVTIPHLVRHLGLEGFGRYSFLLLIAYYSALIPDFGFTQAGPLKLRTFSAPARATYFGQVFLLKILLASLAIFFVALFFLFGNPVFSLSILGSLGLWILGSALNTTWFFQGDTQIRWISVSNLIAKGLFTFFVLFYIRGMGDFEWLIFLMGATQLLFGVLSLAPFFRKGEYLWKGINQQFHPWSMLKEHLPYFTYLINNNILAGSGGFFLNHFHGATTLGFYSTYEKLNRGILALFGPISAALYPILNKEYSQNHHRYIKWLFSFGFGCLILFSTLYFLIFHFLEPISIALFGVFHPGSRLVFGWFSFWSLTGIANHFIGTQYLTIIGQIHGYNRIYLAGNLFFIILCLTLIPTWGAEGLIKSMTMAELLIMAALIYVAWKSGNGEN